MKKDNTVQQLLEEFFKTAENPLKNKHGWDDIAIENLKPNVVAQHWVET